MKIYLRLLGYANGVRGLAISYSAISFLVAFFGLLNFGLLIPAFETLFRTVNSKAFIPSFPLFSLTPAYIKAVFYYYFTRISAEYGAVRTLYLLSILMILSIILVNVCRFFLEIITSKLRTSSIYNLRQKLFSHTLQFRLEIFTHKYKGDITSRLTSDIQEVEHALAYVFKACLRDPIMIICFTTVLVYLSPNLTIIALVTIPVVGGGTAFLLHLLLRRAHKSQAILGRLMHVVEESFDGIRTIKSFVSYNYVTKKFKKINSLYARNSLLMFIKTGLAPLLSEFLSVLVMVGLFLYGGHLVLGSNNTLSSSTFVTYLLIFSQLLTPIKSVARSIGKLQRGAAAGKRIFNLVDAPVEDGYSKNSAKKITFKNSIVFDNVRFSYRKKVVLKGVNFTIMRGQKVVMLGPSGSGKSTIKLLLSRLYHVDSGSIMLDGCMLSTYDNWSLRKSIAVAIQTPMMFHDTIWNNVVLGLENVEQEQVYKAARMAQIHDFIITLPKGYQTIIGTQGDNLSTGQQQRIGLLRALIVDAQLLVLDEATSALDQDTENLIQHGLNKLIPQKTLLIITHRIETAKNADQIIVMDNGYVQEQGTHDSLLQSGGMYARWVEHG